MLEASSIRIYSQDIGMEFENEKYAMLIIKKGTKKKIEKLERQNKTT